LALLVYAPPGPSQDSAEFGFATAEPGGCKGNYALFQETRMATGTVKWFNPTKGYGFIQPQTGGGGKDVFVHISAVEKAGLTSLNEGQHVEYELVTNRGKTSAENLKVK
jgi:CspA family cold shock protein